MKNVKWQGGPFWQLRWLFSGEYRHRRRLAMKVAKELANDPEHLAKVRRIENQLKGRGY